MRSFGPARAGDELEQLVARARRIFQDEIRHGCTDQLVRGGLEAFLRYWVNEASRHASGGWQSVVADVARLLDGYRALSPETRRARLDQALARLVNGPRARASANHAPAPRPATVDASPPRSPRQAAPVRRLALDAPLEQLHGVGSARAKALARLGLRRYGDLLWHLPTRHELYPAPSKASELLFRPIASFEGVVRDIQVTKLQNGLRRITAQLADTTGFVNASWLRAGFAGPRLRLGQRIAVSGRVAAFGRQVVFDNPDWEPADDPPTHTRRMVPVYPLTNGIHLYWLRALIRAAVFAEAPSLEDFLPPHVRTQARLPPLGWAVLQLHYPDSPSALETARRRLAFDELFLIQLVVLQRRLRWQASPAPALTTPRAALDALLEAQPFRFTSAQQRVLEEIAADLARPVAMSRLLQGEVGSGKTAVAAAALFIAAANGGQGVLMAPTEILAEQHARSLRAFYDRAAEPLARHSLRPPRVALLTGSATRRERADILEGLRSGEIDILVGTHAVIQERVELANLVLAIVDEQHRFGVRQRVELRGKGANPHLLVMTATPIPRTLALTLHGDLDLSLIDEMPPGRQRIRTHLLRPTERPLAYEHIRREVAKGRQAFLICPLVEGSPNLEARAAVEEYERLRQGELAGLRLALLHGRMRPAEKDEVMRRFRDHEFDVLVSTAVVEVGVDVPNATVMLIEGAERFGLAQLHQFRGRVGRGQHPATCILLTESASAEALDRLNIMARSNNGLELAEHDLRQRGAGDFFGVRQSGMPALRVATLDDVGLVELARRVAEQLLRADPELSAPEHAALTRRLARFMEQAGEPN